MPWIRNNILRLFVCLVVPASIMCAQLATGNSVGTGSCTLYEDSPFGAHGAFSRPLVTSDNIGSEEMLRINAGEKKPYRHVQDIGIRWIRPGSDIYWRAVQPTLEYVKKGLFDWRSVDVLYGRVPAGVHTLATIDALVWNVNRDPAFKPGTWQFANDDEETYYITFVREVVERYDGDGYKDMPGLKTPIKYWQIGNEPALRPLYGIRELNKSLDWKGFSHLVEISYKAIKASDSEANIALAGMAFGYPFPADPISSHMNIPPQVREREEFYARLLQNLNGKYIDILDIHYYGSMQSDLARRPEGWRWKEMKVTYNLMRNELDRNGYQHTDIWFTETSVPSQPLGETFQAENLVKRYIYPISFGVKKVFWWNIIEGAPPLEVDQPTDHFGLVYDAVGKADPGYGVKKLAYYTYKRMVDKLEGSDLQNIETVMESDHVYAYKFTRAESIKPIWILWWDYCNEPGTPSKKVSLPVGDIKKVNISEAVPDGKSGAELNENDYPNFFKTAVQTVSNRKVTITLKENPVYVEEK